MTVILNTVNISATGAQGTTGAVGVNGLQGVAGLQGISGSQGAQGVQGITSKGLAGIHNIFKLGTSSSLWITANYNCLTNATVTQTASTLYCTPFIPSKDTNYSYLFVNVPVAGSVGSLVRILIYSDLNGKPNTKLYESADLDCSTTGQKLAITTGTFLAGTIYWLCLVGNSSTQQLTRLQLGGLYVIKNIDSGSGMLCVNGYTYPSGLTSTPTTITPSSLVNNSTSLPLIAIAMA